MKQDNQVRTVLASGSNDRRNYKSGNSQFD